TRERKYLEPYSAALAAVDEAQTELRNLTAGDPVQQARLDVIDRHIDTKLQELRSTVQLGLSGNFGGAVTVVKRDEGRQTLDNIRSEITRILAAEEQRLMERQK